MKLSRSKNVKKKKIKYVKLKPSSAFELWNTNNQYKLEMLKVFHFGNTLKSGFFKNSYAVNFVVVWIFAQHTYLHIYLYMDLGGRNCCNQHWKYLEYRLFEISNMHIMVNSTKLLKHSVHSKSWTQCRIKN